MSLTTKKVVLITGCSDGGLGSALILAFLSENYHVFATTRNVTKMGDLLKQPNVTLLDLDVTVDSQIPDAVERVKKTTGRLDILINNAGRNHFSPALDIDIPEAKQIFEINLWGPLSLIKAFMPLLIESKGIVVNTTSISGYLNVPHMGKYYRQQFQKSRSNIVQVFTRQQSAHLNSLLRHCDWKSNPLA